MPAAPDPSGRRPRRRAGRDSKDAAPHDLTRADPTPVDAAMRKRPAQQRSAERVAQILDAAGQMVAERGYTAVTTSVIARRARVPPGTLYDFFTDKRAVIHAAAARNLQRFADRVAVALAEHPPPDLLRAARMILDVYIAMNREDIGFRAIRFGDVVDNYLFDPERDNDALVADRYAALLSNELDIDDTPELRRALVLAVKMADVLVDYAFRLDEHGDPWVLDRTRLLLEQHLVSID